LLFSSFGGIRRFVQLWDGKKGSDTQTSKLSGERHTMPNNNQITQRKKRKGCTTTVTVERTLFIVKAVSVVLILN
jgi:hypothetical protein